MFRDGIGIVLYYDLQCLRYCGCGVTDYKFCSVLGTMFCRVLGTMLCIVLGAIFCGDLVSH